MQARRRLLTGKKSRLPHGYQELLYIDNVAPSHSYIITDVIPTDDLGFDCKFLTHSSISDSSSLYGCIFGGRRSSGNNDFQLTTYKSSTNAFNGTLRTGAARGYEIDAGITSGVVQIAQKRYSIYTNPSGTTSMTSSYAWNQSVCPIYLFALNNNNSPTQYGPGCAIYVMKFYDGDTLIRDYVPAKRLSDGAIGMYEMVTSEFIENARENSSFIAGPSV